MEEAEGNKRNMTIDERNGETCDKKEKKLNTERERERGGNGENE